MGIKEELFLDTFQFMSNLTLKNDETSVKISIAKDLTFIVIVK